MEQKVGAAFIGQIYDIRTKRDGGGRLAIDFGADALNEIQWAQKIAAAKGCNFQIALVPMPNGAVDNSYQDQVDPNTGEILI